MSEKVIEILKGAEKAIKDYGWVRGQYGNCGIGFCAEGAIDFANQSAETPNYATFGDSLDALIEAIPFDPPPGYNPIPYFNDKVATSKEEVLAMFKKARKNLKKRRAAAA